MDTPSQNARQEPRLSVLGGGVHPSSVSRKTDEEAGPVQRRFAALMHTAGLAALCVLLVGAAGCGSGSDVSDDAIVTAYVEAPLCASAKRELAKHGGHAGDLRVRAICLSPAASAKKLSLATLGANARQATEDSTTVAYLEPPDPRASRFTHPILETAEVPWISEDSGAAVMSHLLKLIESSDSGSLRKSLREALNET